VEYLELGDFLVIAEAVLEIPAETLLRFQRVVPLAESALQALQAGFGGVELYPDFEMKAAILCSALSETTRFRTETSAWATSASGSSSPATDTSGTRLGLTRPSRRSKQSPREESPISSSPPG
jgi:hypothetical protein